MYYYLWENIMQNRKHIETLFKMFYRKEQMKKHKNKQFILIILYF